MQKLKDEEDAKRAAEIADQEPSEEKTPPVAAPSPAKDAKGDKDKKGAKGSPK